MSGIDQAATKAAYLKEIRAARESLLHSLVGIPFQESGHRAWVKITGVSPDGAIVENADNPGDGTLVSWERVPDLIKEVARTGLGERNADGWERKTGGGFIYDWPHLVDMSGWTFEDLRGRGISWCLNNRRKGGEEAWVVTG